MTIYTEVSITADHAGFGMYRACEIQASPETSYIDESDLIGAIDQNSDDVLPIEEAILNDEFIALEVEDIDGKIMNQPNRVFARIYRGELSYFGIVESEVDENFFN